MAKKGNGYGNGYRPGRKAASFSKLVSPLGYTPTEANCYSPDRAVNGSYTGKSGSKNSEYSRNERRSG